MKKFLSKFHMLAWLCLPSLFSSGCASTFTHVVAFGPFPEGGYYSGTRVETGYIAGKNAPLSAKDIPMVVFSCLDLPATVALDTVLLPVDAVSSYARLQSARAARKETEKAGTQKQ